MSDNPRYGTKQPFALHGLHVMRLSGRDAVAFAQAQFMNDVTALAPGYWQWNGWLDPKGRVQALFQLLRIDAETLLAVTASPVDVLAPALRRFVFRSKVAIDLPDLPVAGVFARGREAADDRIASEGDVLELDLSGDAGERTLLLGVEAPTDPAAEQEWSVLDLRHGWPGIPGAHLDAWTPQQLSLQRFAAFSVRKGCYPGQEIVARTHFLGRAKREAVPCCSSWSAASCPTGRSMDPTVPRRRPWPAPATGASRWRPANVPRAIGRQATPYWSSVRSRTGGRRPALQFREGRPIRGRPPTALP